MTKRTIGWIGLGRMGEQMADRLSKANWAASSEPRYQWKAALL